MVNESTPFFSIIIPSFNAERVIGNAIQSVLSQTFRNFEIFVVDGKSTDKTVEVVENFQDSRLKFVSEEDNGIYDAMNKGILNTTGVWLMFLGADDSLFDVGTLEALFHVIRANPSSRFVYGDVLTSENYIQRYNDYDYYKLLDVCICHQSITYHRSLFLERMYDTKYKICADWDFNLKVYRSKVNPVYVERPIANFYLGGVSNSWFTHPEYLRYFSNKREMILRYRGIGYLCYYYLYSWSKRLVLKVKKATKNSLLFKIMNSQHV